MNKVYLGDGAFADFDGYNITLTTEDGIRVTNRIVLEPELALRLRAFIRKQFPKAKEEKI